MRNLGFSLVLFTTSLSGSVFANPIMVVNDVSVEQFPGTTHVQITRQYSTGGPSTTTVTRDGAAVTLDLTSFSAGSRNLGSGLSSVYGVVGCDCAVPVGQHSYVVAGKTMPLDVVEASAASQTVRSPSAACDTKCAGSDVPTGGGGGAGPSSMPSTGGKAPAAGGGGVGSSIPGAGSKSTSGGNGGNDTSSPSSVGQSSVGSAGGAESSASSIGTSALVANGGATVTSVPNTGGTMVVTVAKTTVSSPSDGGTPAATSASSNTKSVADDNDNSGCSVSSRNQGFLPVAALAALGLLMIRRRK